MEAVLVTGGTGFIGRALARRLLAAGRRIALLVRSEQSLAPLGSLATQCEPVYADLTDVESVRRAMHVCRPQIVYHLAAYGVLPGQSNRAQLYATNVVGTANLLEALKDQPIERLVFTGSGAEYGNQQGALTEDTPLAPDTDYGVSKAAGSHLCLAAQRAGLPISIVRLFTVYGPGEYSTRLVPYLMDCCARGEAPWLTHGKQMRDFIHVDDVVSLLERAPAVPPAVLHAATGRPHSVRDLVIAVQELFGRTELRPNYGAIPSRVGEPEQCYGDIRQTTQLAGWRPKFDLQSGLQDVYQSSIHRSMNAQPITA